MTDIPQTEREFARWRKKITFATPELADRAELVENDMRLLSKLELHNTNTRAVCEKNIADFKRDYLASRATQ